MADNNKHATDLIISREDNIVVSNHYFCLILGQNSEVAKHKYTLSYQIDQSLFKILIITENDFKPKYILIGDNLILGFNKELNFIELLNCNLVKKINIDERFSEFIETETGDIIVLIETGIICFDHGFNEKWNFRKDVLEDFNFQSDQNIISLQFMDEGNFKLDLVTGQVLL
jgi:hypothetical protein